MHRGPAFGDVFRSARESGEHDSAGASVLDLHGSKQPGRGSSIRTYGLGLEKCLPSTIRTRAMPWTLAYLIAPFWNAALQATVPLWAPVDRTLSSRIWTTLRSIGRLCSFARRARGTTHPRHRSQQSHRSRSPHRCPSPALHRRRSDRRPSRRAERRWTRSGARNPWA